VEFIKANGSDRRAVFFCPKPTQAGQFSPKNDTFSSFLKKIEKILAFPFTFFV